MDTTDVPAPGPVFNIAAHLMERNRERPDKIAYTDDRGTLTYGELADGVRRMGAALLDCGIRREERVLILMHDCNDWPVAFLGSMYAGIVPVAVNTLLTADDYAYMLGNCRAGGVIVSMALLDTAREAMDKAGMAGIPVIVSGATGPPPPGCLALDEILAGAKGLPAAAETSPDEPGFWLYSSGSTGNPKGTVHTHANPYWTTELYGKGVFGIHEGDICFSAAKLFFAYGLGNALTFPLSVGASVVLMAGRPTPDEVFRRLTEQGVTLFFGAPTGYVGMLASPDLPGSDEVSLRLACSAGEALPAELGERFTRQFGVELLDGIGSTEMLHIYLSNRPGDNRYGTTGKPVPGYDIELRGDDGGAVADGEIGDLYVRGPSAALMYWNNREKSRDTFQGAWTKSGDKYVRNPDGTYTNSGRGDDMLRVSGMYVSPVEIEATLMQHDAVLEAAVVGHRDDDGLVKTKACVVLNDGHEATDRELKEFVKSRLAPYKYPRIIEFIDALPKTATGKIQRFRLRNTD